VLVPELAWACDDCTRADIKAECATRACPASAQRPDAGRRELASWARSHGKRVIADARDAARLPDDVVPVTEAQLVEQADALISLGGDGTMLGALRLVAQHPVPVLGVNLGDLGFLVEVQPASVHPARS
jgi:NAD+ kinase